MPSRSHAFSIKFFRARGWTPWLRTARLSLLLPCGIAEAMEQLSLTAAIGCPNAEEKGRSNAMAGSAKVYELRIYHVVPGKLDSLVARFRYYTDKLFAKHEMKSVAYWTALGEPEKSSSFFYILEHPKREAAAANWKAFQGDPEWKAVKAKSEENGKLVEKVGSTFLTLTDFSPQFG